MFKKIVVLAILTFSGWSAYAGSTFKTIKCSNKESAFQLVYQGNPRNNAVARITEASGLFPFGGVWLWPYAFNGGTLITQNQFSTMNAGVLTVAEQLNYERGGCGRGSCETQKGFMYVNIKAHYVNTFGEEFSYDCIKIL